MAAVIVHGLGMARAALRAGVACGRRVTLLSGEGAACYAGAGWWRALVAAAGAAVPAAVMDDVLDCGDAPGRALEALHVGQPVLVLRAEARVWGEIARRARGCGAVLLDVPPPALDLGAPGGERGLEAWLRLG